MILKIWYWIKATSNELDSVTYIYKGGLPRRRKGRNVSRVIVDASVTRIEDRAFQYWEKLASIELPETLTSIGNCAFDGCISLASIVLPSTITSLGYGVFFRCRSLTSVTLNSKITTIGLSTFDGCESLTSVLVPSTITAIGHSAFRDCKSLTTLRLPSITTIGCGVFRGCASLTSVTLPSTITTLGDNTFMECSSLTSITLLSTTTIGARVFSGCSELTAVDLPDKLSAISINAFDGCPRLTTIKAPFFLTTTFSNRSGELEKLCIEAGLSPANLNDILYGISRQQGQNSYYYDIRKWARTRGTDGRLPVFTAAVRSLKWTDMKVIFSVNMSTIEQVDNSTGLPLFMLAATQESSDIESVYNLLKEYPTAISCFSCV